MKKNMNINFMLIGIGPHSKLIYLPYFKKYSKKMNINLSVGIDCIGSEENVKNNLKQTKTNINNIYYVPIFGKKMPTSIENQLNEIIKKHKIKTVIISTPPLSHKPYAVWAMKNNLDILLDKPITTSINAANNIQSARNIYKDYIDLVIAKKKSKSKFMVSSMMRFHPGVNKVYELIKEISCKFKMPVNGIRTYNADGQWRFPDEILGEKYHGYNEGNGKASHSGYHYYDAIYNYLKAGKVNGKEPDRVRVFSSFITPRGVHKMMNITDYKNWFGNKYIHKFSDSEYLEKYKNFGEVDASTLVSLYKGDDIVCNISLDMYHNSYSSRSWVESKKDLFKSNGRIKHEQHIIQQGPFQAIQVHAYKTHIKKKGLSNFDLGGKNHYLINVFRNTDFLDGEPLTQYATRSRCSKIITINDNIPIEQNTYEYARESVLTEFIKFIKGEIKSSRSNLEDHALTVKLMSATYESHCLNKPIDFLIDKNLHPL